MAGGNDRPDPRRRRWPHPSQVRIRIRGESFLPFADGGFATPTGKIEFYSDALAAQGLDPLPGFVPPVESRHETPDNRDMRQAYPLEFLPRKADNYMNSTFANLPVHQKMENGQPRHPRDA